MTSLAFILGVLPLVVATGAGQVARRSVGTAVAGGMFVSTFLNILFIPVLYVVVQTLRGRFGAGGRRHAEDAAGRRPDGSRPEHRPTASVQAVDRPSESRGRKRIGHIAGRLCGNGSIS